MATGSYDDVWVWCECGHLFTSSLPLNGSIVALVSEFMPFLFKIAEKVFRIIVISVLKLMLSTYQQSNLNFSRQVIVFLPFIWA